MPAAVNRWPKTPSPSPSWPRLVHTTNTCPPGSAATSASDWMPLAKVFTRWMAVAAFPGRTLSDLALTDARWIATLALPLFCAVAAAGFCQVWAMLPRRA